MFPTREDLSEEMRDVPCHLQEKADLIVVDKGDGIFSVVKDRCYKTARYDTFGIIARIREEPHISVLWVSRQR